MNGCVTVKYPSGTHVVFPIDIDAAERLGKDAANGWFNAEFDRLGCKSPNPTGKIIMRTVVLLVAEAAGMQAFKDARWAKHFGEACCALFSGKDVVIDTSAKTLQVIERANR